MNKSKRLIKNNKESGIQTLEDRKKESKRKPRQKKYKINANQKNRFNLNPSK